MNPLRLLWEGYIRLRHSRGHGVHSPFAFRLINDVFLPGNYGYYAYARIEKTCRKNSDTADRMKFIFRLMLFLNSRQLICDGENDALRVVAQSCGIKAVFLKNNSVFERMQPGDLWILDNKDIDPSLVAKAIDSGVNILAYQPQAEIRSLLESPLSTGLLMTGKCSVLLIPREEMAYTNYTVSFPFS